MLLCLVPGDFRENVVQLCSLNPALDPAGPWRCAVAPAKRQRRESIREGCAILSDLPG